MVKVRKIKGTMNKRGSFFDLIMLGVFLLIITLTVVFGSMIYNKVIDGISPNINLSAQSNATVYNMKDKVTASFDYIVPVFIIGTGLGIIALAYFIQANPIWYILAIIMMVMGAFVGIIMKDVTQTITSTDADIYSYYEQMPLTNWVVNNIVYIIVGVGLIMAIVMYVSRGDGRSVS